MGTLMSNVDVISQGCFIVIILLLFYCAMHICAHGMKSTTCLEDPEKLNEMMRSQAQTNNTAAKSKSESIKKSDSIQDIVKTIAVTKTSREVQEDKDTFAVSLSALSGL